MIKDQKSSRRRTPPPRTAEAREQMLKGLAMDLAEKQLRDGTATSQLTTTVLKMASVREELELEKLRNENKMLEAKAEALAGQAAAQAMYEDALKAFRTYSGNGLDEDYDVV